MHWIFCTVICYIIYKRTMNQASSSQQSGLPHRVADSRMSVVNATPQSKDSAFGKLNIPKPQSGTSDRRTSFFGKRASGAGMSRNSTFGAFGGVEKMKDPRPLHDKSYIQQCIKDLYEFLSERGFPGTITVKSLQSPSTKEFLKIFEFICSLIDPTFQMPTSKIEEGRKMNRASSSRQSGLPLRVADGRMSMINATPQSKDSAFGKLNIPKPQSGTSDRRTSFFGKSRPLTQLHFFLQLFLEYSAETYHYFMHGADTFEEADQAYIAKLKKLYKVDEAQLETLAEKYRIISEEVERLEKESQTDRLMVKRTEKLRLQTDLQKLQNYNSEMESFKVALGNKAAGISEELEATELQVESLKQEQARLQHILVNQKFSPADVERINRERNELQQTITSLSANLEEAEQHMWNEEIAFAKVKEEAEAELVEYHSFARKLKLIPASAENACGRDFEIKVTAADCGLSAVAQYKVQIQNPLKKMISEVEEETGLLKNKKLSLQEAVEQIRSNVEDKTNEIKDLKEQIRKLDEQLELEMQETAREEEKWASEVESMDNHKKVLERKLNDGYDQALEQLKAAQQQYHLVVQETNEQRRTVVNNLYSMFTMAADHLSRVEL
nr:kinetochore protein NDC80 homolog [Paramormyrops kingsleyae]